MKFLDLNKELKNNIANLYNLMGNDFFLTKNAIEQLKSAAILNLEEFNFVKLDADKLKVSELNPILETMPLGNDYRLIVLFNPSNEVAKYLNKYNFEPYQVVATVNAQNLSNAIIVECDQLDRESITKYILNMLSKFKLSIKQDALDYLIDSCSQNMSKIYNELNKIISYALIEQEIIDINIVSNLVPSSSEYVIYMLTNSIDNKNLANYQQTLSELNKSFSVNEIFAYMGKYFRRMFYIAVSKNDEELQKILNIKPYAIKMSRQNIKNNGVNYYVNLYLKYVELDKLIKSGEISAKNALYELVF